MPSTGSFPLMLVLMEHKLMEFFFKVLCVKFQTAIIYEPDNQELPLSTVKFSFAIPGYDEHPSLSYYLSPFPRIQLTEIKRI
jgi:hypothetical protein